MANIRPFCCIRPAGEHAEEIAALPYDVYNRAEAKEAAANRPLSFLRIDRAEMNFDDSVDLYDERVYQKAKEILWNMVDDGSFVWDKEPYYYIYELTMAGRTQTGIVGVASIDDYEQGVIMRHENTRKEKEEDRIRHVDTCNAQTGPIFLAYREDDVICEIIEKTKQNEDLYDFTSEDGVRHRVFIIHDPKDIETIQKRFSLISKIYIADGHHRCASAVRVGQKRRNETPEYTGNEEFNFFLSVLFPDKELKILDYNRVIKDLNGYTSEQFLKAVCEVADVLPIPEASHPEDKGQFSLLLDGQWYMGAFHRELLSDDPVDGLDVSLLQNHILQPILGINDPKTDKRIDFIGGIRGLGELERRCAEDCACAFALFPTSIEELFAVSDAHRLMPPKSTWFEPKLRSGLFIHSLS